MKPQDTPTPHEAGYKEGHRLGFSFGQDIHGTYGDYLHDKRYKELLTELTVGDMVIDDNSINFEIIIPPFKDIFK